MFIGHFALGFAAKRATPGVSLAILFAAAQFADLLWPVLLAIGLEQVRIDPGNTAFTPLEFVSYPYSHSLLMLVVWGIVFAAAYTVAGPKQPQSPLSAQSQSSSAISARSAVAFVLFALVVSHWVLDYITHRPDMPLYPAGPRLGAGLWNSVAATIAVESVMFAAGVWIYTRATRARDAVGRWGFAGLVAFFVIAYAGNIAAGPPPSVTALTIVAIAGSVITLAWSWWADAHRDGRP